MFRHFIQYYHKEGVVEIQLQTVDVRNLLQIRRHDDNLHPRRMEERSKQIFMRGECQICKTKVLDDIDVSNTLYEYSKARFLEQFFYNDKLENAGTYGCHHRSMRDI